MGWAGAFSFAASSDVVVFSIFPNLSMHHSVIGKRDNYRARDTSIVDDFEIKLSLD